MSDLQDILNSAAIHNLGQTITLSGGSTAQGVFMVDDVNAQFGDSIGADLRVDQQKNRSVIVADADASSFSNGDSISVCGSEYIVSDVIPNGRGLTEIRLMDSTTADDDALQAHRIWR